MTKNKPIFHKPTNEWRKRWLSNFVIMESIYLMHQYLLGLCHSAHWRHKHGEKYSFLQILRQTRRSSANLTK